MRRADDGGLAARRAVVRWAWRLFRREWRQQVLVLTLVTVAVAAAVGGASAAYNTAPSASERLGAASHRLTIDGSDPSALRAELDDIEDWFGVIEVIPQWTASVPGSVDDVDMRAQDPDGPYGAPMLSLRDGRYPTAQDELAITDAVAETFQVDTGGRIDLDGRQWTVVGLVENPERFDDEFALASPVYAQPPDEVEVLLDTTEDRIRARPETGGAAGFVEERGTTEKGTAALVTYLVATVVLLLVALVAGAGFVVMAQRRQRQIGLLAATGATDKHLRLVMLANGAAVGAFAAIVGTTIGVLGWFAAAPRLENAAGHRIDVRDVPWWVVAPGMLLAVLTAMAASWWPARVVARLSITQALSGRPPRPKPARRSALIAGLLVGLGAACIMWSNPDRTTTAAQPVRDVVTQVGVLSIVLGILFVCPLAVRALGRVAGRFPVAARLALRDLGRYSARSGAALCAMSLAVGIPLAVVVTAAAADHGEAGNLSDRQLLVRVGSPDMGPFVLDRTPEEIEDLDAQVERLAATVDAPAPIALDRPLEPGTEPTPGMDGREGVGFGVPVDENTYGDVTAYVATPELLELYGIDPGSIDSDVDVLTTRTDGLVFHTATGRADPEPVRNRQQLEVTDYTSAPTSLITLDAIRRRGWDTARVAWLIESRAPLSRAQLADARDLAADAGVTIESRRDADRGSIRRGAVAAGTLVALAVVAMTVGLLRSEAAADLRTLTATGASSTMRRKLTAWTAGALGLLGVLLGALGAYVALASGYVRDLGNLANVPVAELLGMAVGVPLLAAAAGWLLGGRQPSRLLHSGGPLATVVVVMALVSVAACGGGSGGKNPGEARSEDRRERAPLPLDEWWASVGGSDEQQREQERRVEQRVADCMQARGFDYTPLELHPGATPDTAADGPWSLPADEFAERYGYGLFTIDHPGLVDPNAARLAAMSEAERAAYEEALHGSPEESGQPADSTSGPAESGEPAESKSDPVEQDESAASGACVDEAWAAEVDVSLISSEQYAGLQEEIDALFERTDSDPKVEDAARGWVDCMADADPNYRDFATPEAAKDSVFDRYIELAPAGSANGGIEGFEMNGVQVYRLRGVDLTAIPADDLRAVRDYEVQVATSDYRCRTEYDDVRYEVQFELEQEFIEEHGEELERFREAFAAASGGD